MKTIINRFHEKTSLEAQDDLLALSQAGDAANLLI